MAQTNLANTQVAVASTGGGTNPVAAQNTSAANLTETGTATGQTGVSVARSVPTTTTGAPAVAGSGTTNAASGGAQATGVTAQNNVANTSIVVAQVGGANAAPVSVQANNSVVVQDAGAANATSGTALAQPAGADTTLALPNPVPPAAQPASGPTTPGLDAQTSVSGDTSSTTTVRGAPAGGPVDVTHTQQVAVNAVGAAQTTSTAGLASPAAAPATGASGTTVTAASTGQVSAHGVVAQNNVSQTATASVQIAGQNFAPIQIIIDSITRIFNLGTANAASGAAAATGTQLAGGSAAPPTSVAPASAGTSADVSATGATVSNQVSLSSSALVHVTGDNFNPINLFLQLIVSLSNVGIGNASSGATQGGSAQTGNAVATGLQAENDVSLLARAGVQVDGSNYAPITVHVLMETDISNTGQASATSGDSTAVSHPAAMVAASTQPSPTATPTTTPSPSPLPSSSISVGTSANVAAPAGPQDTSSISLRSQLSTSPNATATQTTSTGAAPPALVQPGTHAWSGDASCLGSVSDSTVHNTQVSVAANPGGPSLASNSLQHAVTSSGDVACNGGFAGVNATPTPRPTAAPTTPAGTATQAMTAGQPSLANPAGPTSADVSLSTSATGAVASGQATDLGARLAALRFQRIARRVPGEIVTVTWRFAFPIDDAPVMPGQRTSLRPRGSQPVTAATQRRQATGYPASDLPLPDQTTPRVDGASTSTSTSAASSVSGRPPAAAHATVRVALGESTAAVVDQDTDQASAPVPGSLTDLVPTVAWGDPGQPSMPGLLITPGAASGGGAGGGEGGWPIDPLAAAATLLGTAALGAAAARGGRRRLWLASLNARAALLRLTLSLLRIW